MRHRDTEQRHTGRLVSGVQTPHGEKRKQSLDSEAGKRNMHTAPLRKSEAALLFNNLSNNVCVGTRRYGFLTSQDEMTTSLSEHLLPVCNSLSIKLLN